MGGQKAVPGPVHECPHHGPVKRGNTDEIYAPGSVVNVYGGGQGYGVGLGRQYGHPEIEVLVVEARQNLRGLPGTRPVGGRRQGTTSVIQE
jgi:hypothetical protein